MLQSLEIRWESKSFKSNILPYRMIQDFSDLMCSFTACNCSHSLINSRDRLVRMCSLANSSITTLRVNNPKFQTWHMIRLAITWIPMLFMHIHLQYTIFITTLRHYLLLFMALTFLNLFCLSLFFLKCYNDAFNIIFNIITSIILGVWDQPW